MKIETKYDIGEIVKFNRVITYGGKKKSETEEHVGIIEKILVSGEGKISYLMKSSYQNWIKEDDILAVLVVCVQHESD